VHPSCLLLPPHFIYNCSVIDADAQRSSSKWASSLTQTIPCQVIGDADSLIEQVDKLAQEWDFVIIDGPGSLAEVTRAIVLLADLALMPCQPTGLDLGSASETVRLIAQAKAIRKGMPKGVTFLSRAVKGTRLKEEAKEFLEDMPGITLLTSIVHQRQVIADSVGQQAVVWTMSDRAASDAAREYNKLLIEVIECLNEKH
jgi:chromosome partitioning protein